MNVLKHISNHSAADWSTLYSESGQWVGTSVLANLPGSAGRGLRAIVNGGQAYADSSALPQPSTWAISLYARLSWSEWSAGELWALAELYSPVCPTVQVIIEKYSTWEPPRFILKAYATHTGESRTETYIDDMPIEPDRWYHLMVVGHSYTDTRAELYIDRVYRGAAHAVGNTDNCRPVRFRAGLYSPHWPWSPATPSSRLEAHIDEITVATGLSPAERVTAGPLTQPGERSVIRRAVCV
ncbi:MAG: hypothetical protein ACP5HU_10405 [Phycisphaerae bacterium]